MSPAQTPSIQQRVAQRRRNRDLSLSVKLSAIVAVAVLILVVGALGVFLVREYSAAQALVSHSREVQQTLNRVLQRLTDAETGQRGYLLTNAEEFLQPYRGASKDVVDNLARLREFAKNDESVRRDLTLLEHAVQARVVKLDERIEERRAGGQYSLESLRDGKAPMDSVRSVLVRMHASAESLLVTRQRLSEREGRIAIAVILPGSALAFGLLLLLSTTIRRDMEQRDATRLQIESQNVEFEAQTATLANQQVELERQLEESLQMTQQLKTTNEELQRVTVIAEAERIAAEQARDQFRVSDARYRFLADTIPVQVWTAAADGQLDFVSQGVADYFGRQREEIVGEGWLAVIHPDDVSPVVERWTHSLATGEPYEVNVRLRRSDGAYRWHLGRAHAQRDDDESICGWFGSNTDIDDQHRDFQHREHLVRTLELANVELDQFAYIASHDLKAPLRGIANLSEWIEEDVGDGFPKPAREKMGLLRGRVRRLEALIDGILEYSRAGRRHEPPTAIEIDALVAEVVEMLAPPPSARVDIEPNLPQVISERIPLHLVLSNLLDNAIKYAGRPDARIRVAAVPDGHFIHFRILDNGPGIAPQFQQRIFVVFQRLVPRDGVEGTGIGLSIVKKIVEGQGGRVWVQSPADLGTDSGSAFHFTWPRSPSQEF